MLTVKYTLTAGVMIAALINMTGATAGTLPKALIITGDGNAVEHDYPYPRWRHEFQNDEVTKILDGIVDVTVTDDLSALNDKTLARYDLLINNSILLTPAPEQFEAFYRYIEGGKPYLAMHSAMVSFLNSDRYERLLGGRFVGGPANEPERFKVYTHDAWLGYDYMFSDQRRHPVTLGVPDFTTEDELYLMQTNTAELEVLARAENHPVMWLRPWGKGKVMGLTLGHSLEAKRNPGYQTLLQNGVRWLTGYPILAAIPDGRFIAEAKTIGNYVDLDALAHHADGAPLRFAVTGNTDPELVNATIDEENKLRLRFSGQRGTATITLQAQDPAGKTDTSAFTVSALEKGSGNLALYHGVSAHSSSNEGRRITNDPARAHDGDRENRWSSDYIDPSWIYLDLGSSYNIERVTLLWDGAYAKKYEIQASKDPTEWTTVFAENNGDGSTDDIRFTPVNARYVRMYGTQRAIDWGYSLYEFEVYGRAPD